MTTPTQRLTAPRARSFQIGVAAVAAWLLLTTSPTTAEERKFALMTAWSPKEQPSPDLVNIQEIGSLYFDNDPFNFTDSFAEYWNEVSYGDITVSGRAFGWVPLPWRYHAPGDNRPQDYIDLDRSFSYRYGVGEDVVSGQEMLLTDWNGTILFNGAPDASHADQTGVLEDASPTLPPDVAEEDLVWTPGERFLDLDADGVYDALNEVIAVDWNLGSAAELLGTTPPADPDGDPTILNSWKDTDWDDSDTLTFIENCVLSLGPPECARNDDDQPEGPGGEDCKEPPGCETPENPEPCCLPDCCEFNDKDDDGALAIAEPYEDFMRTYNPLAGPDPNPGHWPIMDPVYVNDNYPGNVDGLLEYDPLYNSTGRTNNGFYNPPDKWRERGNTKMIQDHTDAWITPDTPAPGTYPNSPVEVQGTVWYEDFWTDWYGDTSPPPNWTGRTPTMVELDTTMWRYFNPNRGALDGFGRGSAADPVQSRSNWDPMTSSPVDPFVGTIRPDDLGFYDGPVEHDDLPSSKYHRPFGLELSQGGGDQRLGEVTSPFSDSIWGHDRASHNPSVPGGGEGYLAAAGPYAINIHGGSGLDGGNVLYLEWLTWRRDGTSPTVSVLWDLTYGPHPYQGPGEDTDSDGIGDDGLALGFRDYNLDGILDQGEVRPAGSENYLIDEDPTTDNFGSATRYPWNRRRLLEDVIEALDFSVDFDPYVDANSLTSNGTSGFGGMAGIAQLLGAKGALSGLLLLPAGAVTDDELRNPSPGLYYIHNEDQPPDPNVWPPYNWSIWSHDLATDMDNEGAAGVPATDFHNGYAAHEYMHAWENLPDLYDYDVWADDPLPEQNPIGRWGIMAKGGLTHPVAILKADRGWIDPVSLNQILTPGVPKQLTLPPAEFVRTDSYYYFDNPSRARQERQWFWSAGQSFDRRMPMPGMIVLHTDRDDNAEGLPPQQSLEGHFTYYIVQADGQFDLDEAEPPFGNGNAGDAGDVFPGATSNRSLGFGTSPQSRWWDLSPTGLNVDQIEHDFFSGVTTARFTWTPLEVPSLQIVNPPGGESLPDPFTGCENKYQVNYNAFDLYGGTDVEFYWVMEDESYTPLSFPTTNPIATVTEKSPGAVFGESIDWCIDGLVPERVYHVFAKLVPGEGEQSNTENQFIMIPGRNNGDGTISGVTVDPQNAKLEAWTIVKCATLDADCNPGTAPVATQDWLVTGTISGVQKSGMLSCDPEVPNPRYAVAGQPYTTDDGEMTFTITEDASEPFECGDSFVIATTGFTTHSAGVWINVHGEITEAPTAKITADPLFGEPPLTVKFKALSEDPNNEPMTHTWDFGDGGTAAGKEVEHEFDVPGTWSVTLISTNDNTGAFGADTIDVVVTNDRPTAEITANPAYISRAALEEGNNTARFDGGNSNDPECNGSAEDCLLFNWDFGDESPSSDLVDVNHTFDLAPGDAAKAFTVTLTVTDLGGSGGAGAQSHTTAVDYWVGNAPPTVSLAASPTTPMVDQEVTFRATATDEDEDDLKYVWKFGDGNTETTTDSEITHKYSAGGAYNASVTVTDIRGTTELASVMSNVLTLNVEGTTGEDPVAKISATPTSGPAPLLVSFDASDSSDPQDGKAGLGFLWTFGDGDNSTDAITEHEFKEAKTYTVTLQVTDKDTNIGTATVLINASDDGDDDEPDADNDPPVASFRVLVADEEVAGAVSGAAPLTAKFESTSTDANDDELSHSWDFGDGSSDTGSTVEHQFDEAGTYTVTLTVTDPGELADSASREVEVGARPNKSPVARMATFADEMLTDTAFTFDANLSSDEDEDALTFTWMIRSDGAPVEAGGEMTGAKLSVNFRSTEESCQATGGLCLTPGTYTIEVTVDDGFGGVDATEPRTIIVMEGPGADLGDVGAPVTDEGGAGSSDRIPITGSSSGRSQGLCGLGLVLPMMLSLLVLAAAAVGRRRR